MRVIIDFHKAVFRMAWIWRVWMMILALVNMVLPLVLIRHAEAQVTLVVFLLSAGFMMVLFKANGFTRILGVGHVLWLGLVPWLALQAQTGPFPPNDLFGWWLIATVAVNGLSIAIDIVDVLRYVRGDRQPAVALE